MARKFLSTNVPLYYVIFLLTAALGTAAFVMYRYSETIYRYQVFLGDGNPATDQELHYGSWPALANAEFFNGVKRKFVDARSSFVEADLSAMQLTVYDHGAEVLAVPILTKGKEGSWWETPAGLYEIGTKEEKHFSSFAGVYMPWSLPFQGNFFIHGWPYYPDGTPVESQYSGGCIRLSTADAEKVYNLVNVGTPVLVFEEDFRTDTSSTFSLALPPLTAQHYLVADLASNFVFAERGSTDIVPIASITKLVTALVAAEYINLETSITIRPEMVASTSLPRLAVGERVLAYDLLYPLLMESSNEAAEAFADWLGRDRFIGLMNEKAKSLGMIHTTFVDPSGAGAGNVSTAEDLFNLLKHLANNRSFILDLTAGRSEKSAYGAPTFTRLQNFNYFADRKDFVGGKVGSSQAAGETMASVFRLPFGNGEREVAVIVLGSKESGSDTAALVSYVPKTYILAP